MYMKLLPLAAIVLGVLTGPSTARAWGADGHRLIAELADNQLMPATRSVVARLLAAEPGATLASVSTWADEIRSRSTAPWHYVNPPPGDCSYDRARDCDDDQCVVEALNKQVAVLTSKAPDSERLTALKWVIHLVGDIHQPLHAGFKGDKGGNLYQVQAFGRGTNLHSLWDGVLVRNHPGGLEALRSSAATVGAATPLPPSAAAWAIESCKVVLSSGFYPEGRFIDQSYVDQWDAVLVTRLKSAAHRLAATLNDSLH
jgi:hypothetical protein